MTAEEFIRVYGQDDDDRHELIDGDVYERTLNGSTHDYVKNNLKELFDQACVADHGFKCWIEHSFRITNTSVMTPDVAIFRAERLAGRKGNSPTAGAPEIAFEVTITDSISVFQRKVSAYLRNGALAVCCVYPSLRVAVVYTAHEWRELTEADRLEFPVLLPGVSIPVSALFEGI